MNGQLTGGHDIKSNMILMSCPPINYCLVSGISSDKGWGTQVPKEVYFKVNFQGQVSRRALSQALLSYVKCGFTHNMNRILLT